MKNIKKLVILLCIIVLFGGITITGMKIVQIKKESESRIKEQNELELLYYRQNTAFELGDLDKRYCYYGANELKLNVLIVQLYAYNSAQSKYEVTVDDVINYLSDEYDSYGKPKIYSQPENIKAYIYWNIRYGNDAITKYGDAFNDYMGKHGYSNHFYRSMSYEEVVTALEEFQEDPEYQALMQTS